MKFFTLILPCTEDALKSAYRAQAHAMHPDVGGDPSQFIAMQREYATLTANPMTFTGPRILAYTSDGYALSTLGLGVGPTINGRPCTACASAGYRRIKDYDHIACPDCRNTRMRFLCSRCHRRGWVTVDTQRFERCWECKGAGEIIVFNPVIPKGRLNGR
jgi:DnaJ-class molecular chaperone